jgi:hypothetical protein
MFICKVESCLKISKNKEEKMLGTLFLIIGAIILFRVVNVWALKNWEVFAVIIYLVSLLAWGLLKTEDKLPTPITAYGWMCVISGVIFAPLLFIEVRKAQKLYNLDSKI